MRKNYLKKIGTAALLLLFFSLIFWFFVSHYQRRPGTSPSSNRIKNIYPGEIVIGMETWPGYLALPIADAKGFFKEAGLNVRLKRYDGLGELSRDYLSGRMQGRANLTLDAINETLSGFKQKVVLAIDYSNGSDAIVSRGIREVKDFKGKKVGYEPGTLEEFFIAWALEENELNLTDIVSVPCKPGECVSELKEGTIDVAVTHEPFLSQLGDGFPIVFSSAAAPGLITNILTFRTDFIETYPETVEAVIGAYFRALNFWRENPKEGNAIAAKFFGDRPENIAKQLKGITMLDERDNRTAFTFAAGLKSLYGNLRNIGEFVQSRRHLKQNHFDTDTLIDRRFITLLENK